MNLIAEQKHGGRLSLSWFIQEQRLGVTHDKQDAYFQITRRKVSA